MKEGFSFSGLYHYRDEDGEILYSKIRLDNGEGKWIRPISQNGNGWILKEPSFPTGKSIYRLPDLAKSPEAKVWIVEGENCVEALIQLGAVATTSGSATRHAPR